MAITDTQRMVLQILYKNKPNKMNHMEIAKVCGKNSGAIASTLRALAARDLVYQLDMQGRTTISGDGQSEL